MYLYVFYEFHKKTTISLYIIQRLVYIAEKQCVYCEVRAQSVNVTKVIFVSQSCVDCLVGISTLKTPKNEEREPLFLLQLSYQVDKKSERYFSVVQKQ